MATSSADRQRRSSPVILALAWLAVGVPLLWGMALTLERALALFR
jgi:hypothetical protein